MGEPDLLQVTLENEITNSIWLQATSETTIKVRMYFPPSLNMLMVKYAQEKCSLRLIKISYGKLNKNLMACINIYSAEKVYVCRSVG